MSAGVGGDSKQDVELNLAPIIDCFTVLITYLLVSASFISFTVLDVGIAAIGQGVPPVTDKSTPPSLSLVLAATNSLEIKLSGGSKNLALSYPINAQNGQFDVPSMTAKFYEILKEFSDVADISVSAEPTVPYKDVVRLVESVRKTIPKVYLSE